MRKALQQYQNVNLESDIESASPYRITQMLLEGCIRFLKQARFAIEKEDYEKKSHFIAKSQAIIATLGGSVDKEAAPELSENLVRLYDFAIQRITDSAVDMDVGKLDEAIEIIAEIKAGWDSIPPEEIARAEAIRASK